MKSINLKTDKGMLEWQNMLQMHQDAQKIANTKSIEGYNELPSNNQTHRNQLKKLDGKPNSNMNTHSFFHIHKNKQTNKPTQLDNDEQLHENNGNLGIISESNQRWDTGRH